MPSDRLKSALSTGWRRTLLITFFAQLLTAVGFSSIFPFLPLYVQSLGARSGLSIELLSGLVYSAQAATMMIASPIWGALADRYGRKLMVERSMFGGAILLLLMAFVRSAEELVLLRALQGLVTGTLAASNALVAATVPRERSGYAMGLLQVALGAGVSLGPLLGGSVADAWGYGAAFYVTAALLFLSGVTVLVGVEEAFVPVRDPSGGHAGFLARWRRVLSGPGVPLAYALRFMTQLGRMTILPVLPLFIPVLLKGATRVNTFTGLVVGASAGTAMLSAAYLGRLGDRVGHRRIVILSTLLAAVFYLPQSLVTEGWQLLVLQAMVGIAMGGFLPGISALLAGLTRSGDEGAVYGLDNSIRAAARSVAPLLGAGVALWFGLRTTFAAAAVLFFLTALLAAWRLPSGKDLPQPEPNKEPYPS